MRFHLRWQPAEAVQCVLADCWLTGSSEWMGTPLSAQLLVQLCSSRNGALPRHLSDPRDPNHLICASCVACHAYTYHARWMHVHQHSRQISQVLAPPHALGIYLIVMPLMPLSPFSELVSTSEPSDSPPRSAGVRASRFVSFFGHDSVHRALARLAADVRPRLMMLS